MAHPPVTATEDVNVRDAQIAVEALTDPQTSSEARRLLTLIALGLFITTFAQPQYIGKLPLQFLLKNEVKIGPQQMAVFFSLGAFAWYLKPFAGLLADSFPLAGSRRRYYLLLSAGSCALLWLLLGFTPHRYQPLLIAVILLNTAMMFVSTVIGGLFVEEGQRRSATGRLSSLRMGLINTTALLVGPLGGWLASRAFGITAGLGAGLFGLLAVSAFFILREPTRAPRNTKVWSNAGKQLKTLFASKPLWAAAGMQFLVYIAPGFSTPLFYYQTNTLKFSEQFIGNLGVISGLVGIGGSLLYATLCRRKNLRFLLVLGIVANAFGTLSYLAYRSEGTAILVEGIGGLIVTLSALPLFDLAARGTPKGCESMGYALLMSVGNIASAISDILGARFYEEYHWTFLNLVGLNAGTTLLALVAVPFLPRILINRPDGA